MSHIEVLISSVEKYVFFSRCYMWKSFKKIYVSGLLYLVAHKSCDIKCWKNILKLAHLLLSHFLSGDVRIKSFSLGLLFIRTFF